MARPIRMEAHEVNLVIEIGPEHVEGRLYTLGDLLGAIVASRDAGCPWHAKAEVTDYKRLLLSWDLEDA